LPEPAHCQLSRNLSLQFSFAFVVHIPRTHICDNHGSEGFDLRSNPVGFLPKKY
jgi:hypothetical protein